MLRNVYADLLRPNYRVIDRAAFASLLSRSGIEPGTTVVVFGYAASLGFWMLAHYGHRRMSFLNGSRGKWIHAGLPLSTDVPLFAATGYRVSDFGDVHDEIRACHHHVSQAIDDLTRQLMDVRSVPEYTGERFCHRFHPRAINAVATCQALCWCQSRRRGARTGASNRSTSCVATMNRVGSRPRTRSSRTALSGGRASQAWFVLTYLLGYPRVRVYDGSWIEWGTLPGVPVEQ